VSHPVLTTSRLLLTPYTLADVDELHRVMSDQRVMQHIGKGALTREEVLEIVLRDTARWDTIGMGWWCIRLRDTRYLIGQICLRPDADAGEVAVGYALDADHWRRGYAREALGAVLRHGFATKALTRIVATVRPENSPSCALLETCGFRREPDVFVRSKTLRLYACSKVA
jgi:RimJ/RimL family protein N-acetyltransferase